MANHIHLDEREVARVMDRLDVHQRKHEAEPGIVGIQARLQLAGLRPIYLAMVREANAGADIAQLRRAVAGFISNLVMCVADSATNKVEPERTNQLKLMMIEIGFCVGKNREDNEPGGDQMVRGQRGGHA